VAMAVAPAPPVIVIGHCAGHKAKRNEDQSEGAGN
jgi:hypothetical protein